MKISRYPIRETTLEHHAYPPFADTALAAIAAGLLALHVQGARACSYSELPQARAESCNHSLARTINFGNMLDVARDGTGLLLDDKFFTLSKKAGFTAVRLTVRWDTHAGCEPPYAITQTFFKRVDSAVTQAQANGLAFIIDMHYYDSIHTNPDVEKPRFLALWKQIAERYRNAPATVMFEMLNEPHGSLTQDVWNRFLPEVLKVVRISNPNRTLIVGGAEWNSRDSLETLQLPPDDRNLIVSFHYYDPMKFTHQGAEWERIHGSMAWLGTTWRGTSTELKTLNDDFVGVAQWAKLERRPVLLGEFGAYFRCDETSRVAWTKALREQAEALGFSWGYWELAAGFGVLEPRTLAWRKPLLRALLPQSPVLPSATAPDALTVGAEAPQAVSGVASRI